MRMAIGFKAYSQNKKVRPKNILQQPTSVANTTSKPNPKKQKPTQTDQHNFKDENGDWIQSIFSEWKSSLYSSMRTFSGENRQRRQRQNHPLENPLS
jgi:hypothetical protein